MTNQITAQADPHLNADQPGICSAAVADRALRRMSTGFERQDLGSLLESFSEHSSATYAGSEAGEIATGKQALRELLIGLVNRDVHYSFTFSEIRAQRIGEAVWVLADCIGHETTPDGAVQAFPYRVSGLLLHERGDWRWALLTGAEPTPPHKEWL